jgi:hydroxymethylglutaryl-CoA synthase
MILDKKVGIVSYGTAIPGFAIKAEEIELAQNRVNSGIPQSLGVMQKSMPDLDEDTATLATRASWQAIDRMSLNKAGEIGTLFIGSESHPYAVKPTGTIVKQALGLSEEMSLVDMQFACKAGTQAMQSGMAHVLAGFSKLALAVGADTAQSQPGDVLEFTAGAGAAAFVLGKSKLLAKLVATTSIATDTPDFWRRTKQNYPQHAGRFSGDPGYFYHVVGAAKKIMAETGLKTNDFDYCIFHTPNKKFPVLAAKKLGFSQEQLEPSLVVKKIGNTYAAAVPVALAAVLDVAKAKERILVVSYGSGAGSDVFVFETTTNLVNKRKKWSNSVLHQLSKLQYLNYENYRRRSTH